VSHHAVVDRLHQLVRVGGDDAETLEPAAIGLLPYVPQAGEGEGLAVCNGKRIRLFGLGVDLLPLVEPSEEQGSGGAGTVRATWWS
jgi:hypothetical protein